MLWYLFIIWYSSKDICITFNMYFIKSEILMLYPVISFNISVSKGGWYWYYYCIGFQTILQHHQKMHHRTLLTIHIHAFENTLEHMTTSIQMPSIRFWLFIILIVKKIAQTSDSLINTTWAPTLLCLCDNYYNITTDISIQQRPFIHTATIVWLCQLYYWCHDVIRGIAILIRTVNR